MAVKLTAGSKFYIGPQVTTAAGDTLAELQALTYVEVGEVENLGDFGDEAPLTSFTSLSDNRVRKLPGANDAGVMPITVGRDPLNAGQIDMVEAQVARTEYAFKVVLADKPSDLYSNSEFYFRGVVSSQRISGGGANDVTKMTYNVAINSELFVDLAALL